MQIEFLGVTQSLNTDCSIFLFRWRRLVAVRLGCPIGIVGECRSGVGWAPTEAHHVFVQAFVLQGKFCDFIGAGVSLLTQPFHFGAVHLQAVFDVLGVLFLLHRELLVEDDLGHLLEDLGMVIVNRLQYAFEFLIDDAEQSNELGEAQIR